MFRNPHEGSFVLIFGAWEFIGSRPLRRVFAALGAVAFGVCGGPYQPAIPSAQAAAATAPARTPAPRLTPLVVTFAIARAAKAANVLRSLYPAARITVDTASNALVIVAQEKDADAIRAIAQGIDVRDPTAPATEAVALHTVKPADIVPRLRAAFPGARVDAGPNRTLIVTANQTDMAAIKSLLGTVDAPATAAPVQAATPSTTEAVHVVTAHPRDVAREVSGAVRGVRAAVAGDSVVLSGSPDAVAQAKTLVGVLDQPPNGVAYSQIYQIKYIDADSIAALIGRTFPNAQIAVDKALNALTIVAPAAVQRRIADGLAQLDTTGSAGGPASANGLPVGQPGTDQQVPSGGVNYEIYTLRAAIPGLNGAASTSATDIAQTVQQVMGQNAPDLKITVSPNQQQLIIAGSPYTIKTARTLVEQLDIAQQLVVLDTQVLEVNATAASDLGISLSQPLLSSTFSEASPPPDASGNPQRLLGLQAIQRTPLSLGVQLGLLVQHGNARVLADPRITTVSGRTATIRAGDTIAIQTTAGGGAGTVPTTQLQTFQTGVTLDITPIVNAGNFVTVVLHPVVNSETGILNGIPQISTRDTQTTVELQEDQTLVIGGLIQDSSTRTDTKIPVLGDIPLIGRLFHEVTKNSQRDELVITVTPHIVRPGQPVPFPGTLLLPQGRPTLAPDATLPPLLPATPLPAPVQTLAPAPQEAPGEPPPPRAPPTPPARTSATGAAPSPSPSGSPNATPSAFAATNTFTYGQAPQNNFAGPTDSVQIFYATFSPTVLRAGTPVRVAAVTTTNVTRLTVGYSGFTTQIAPNGPGKWQSTYTFNGAGLPVPPANVSLVMTASRLDGTSTSINVPVSIAP